MSMKRPNLNPLLATTATPIFVTVVAGHPRAPDVRPVVPVSVVYPGPGVASAIRTHENHIARGIRMTRRADAIRVAVIETPQTVGKRRSQPTVRVMASRAGGFDDSGDGGVGGEVIRYRPAERCGALPLSGVATVTIEWRRSRSEVTKVAGHGGVRAG